MMKKEDFDEEFFIHYKTVDLPVDRGLDEKAYVVVFEKKEKFDSSYAFVFNHGATSIADTREYGKEANEIMIDDEFSREEKQQMADMLRDRGSRFDNLPISYLESRKLESAVDSWRRVRHYLGDKHPQYTASVSYGDKGLYILAPDSQGKRIKNATVKGHNKLVDEALAEVGSAHKELWSISHSMGGLNSLAVLMDQAKSGSNRISKAFIADMLLFPGDINASMLLEFITSMRASRIIARMFVQIMLHETEWRETNPLGKNFMQLKNFPPTLLHSNSKSMWLFDVKHNELMAVAKDMGADQIEMITTATSHSFFAGRQVAQWFTQPPEPVSDKPSEPLPVQSNEKKDPPVLPLEDNAKPASPDQPLQTGQKNS